MKILILGGTEFLGRYLVYAAEARNHEVTLFNRGKTNPELFPHLEKLRGDREGSLDDLKGRCWNAVIDTCGYVSWKVRAAATLLADSVEHYTLVSSVSVYRDFSAIGINETGSVEELAAGAIEDETNDDSYGARKVLCERAVEKCMPGRVLNVRAGLIVGPHAGIDRFPYWVRRVARGGNVLAPGSPDALVQLIDVRDLARWIVLMAENRRNGTYNATGPETRLTFLKMLEQCRAASGSSAEFVWVNEDFLADRGVKPFSELPFWLPGQAYAGFFTLDCRKAFASGLACRPLIDTARDTLLWDRERDLSREPPKRPTVLAEGRIGLESEREQQLIADWRASERQATRIPSYMISFMQ